MAFSQHESVGDLDSIVNVLNLYYEKSWNVADLKTGIIFDELVDIVPRLALMRGIAGLSRIVLYLARLGPFELHPFAISTSQVNIA